MSVSAEGVEDEDQAAVLKACGCVLAQGFSYSKPLPLGEMNHFLESGR
jgi:EAL domain-containing protein (putative c-di-GMP-specific phosphodiesterase class I)